MQTNDRARRLWIFSFDGTLTAPNADRSKARLHRLARELLGELAAAPRNLVAVISSRSLEDLVSRVPIPEIFLGGGCGTEWHIPGGESMTLSGRPKELLMETRERLLPLLRELASQAGIELEDRRWSAAFHLGNATQKLRRAFGGDLEELLREWRVALYRRDDLYEVQFLPEITMEFGARALCRFLGHDGGTVCAGSDENDATALRWVARNGGVSLSVGRRPLVPGAQAVADLRSLVRQVRDLAAGDLTRLARRPEHRLSKAA